MNSTSEITISENAKLERIVFHIIGPNLESPKILLEVDEPEKFSSFFVERLKEALRGTAYTFKEESWVREQITQAFSSQHAFVDTSERLALKFQEQYKTDKRLAPGALMLLQIKNEGHYIGAIIKYDDMSVVSYTTEEQKNGKTKPILSEILNNFVQDKKAIQKATIFNPNHLTEHIICIDRSGSNGDITDKFRDYLQAHRLFTKNLLTERLLGALIEAGKENCEILPNDIKKRISSIAKQAIKDCVDFDPEQSDKLLTAAFGAAHSNEQLKKSFDSALKKRKILHEKFSIDKEAIKHGKTKIKQTHEGIRVIYNKDHEEKGLITFEEEGGKKIIKIVTEDYSIEDEINE